MSSSQTSDLAFLNEWLASTSASCRSTRLPIDALQWDGERLFQAAKFGTEMQYQHLVFEEFARKIQPQIDVFLVPQGYDATIDPAIVAEFAHVVYRFGHSMLTETIDRFDADLHRRPHRPDRGLPQPDRVPQRRHRRRRGGRLDHPRHDPAGRQRDRRVRHRRAAQQPARPAARPRDDQPGARPRHRRAVAQRGAARVLRGDRQQPSSGRTTAGSTSPATSRTRSLDRQLHRRLRHARPDHRRRRRSRASATRR